MSDWYDAGPSTYTGAPDECNVHWPTKLVDGECPKCEAHRFIYGW